jgi:glycosyltransferase involved in cell wall biosynthesis
MPRFFALADALLVTLRREPIFSFTIPSKIQSYLACGRPVIAALDGEGARVVEEAGAGYAVPPEDPAALAAAVLRMRALDAAGRAAMGGRGTEYFARCFDRNRLLDQLETLMRQVTGKA